MRIIVTGSSGLVGSALIPRLLAEDHEVTRFVRDAATPPSRNGVRAVAWNIERGEIDDAEVSAHDAVIHLAGEPVAEGRWTTEKKRRIHDSRVRSTELLAASIARADPRPKVFISASAIGIYGDRAAEILDEDSALGNDFLAAVGRDWERAADAARAAGVRVVHPRIGVVLTPRGGALAKLLTPFKLGAGGRIGAGTQYMSWITLDDLIAALTFMLTHTELAGAFNCVAPEPVTNAEFTEKLAGVLARPSVFTVPKFAARLAFGEMADAVLLASQRVVPRRLQEAGFTFRHPQLEAALRYLLAEEDG